MKYRKYILITTILLLIISLVNRVIAQSKTNTSRQIELLTKEKNSRTAIQQKIDSRLLQAIREKQGKKIAGVNLEPANVNADSDGNLKVDIDATVSDSLINNIQALGGTVLSSFKQYHTIQAKINFFMVEKIAAYSAVTFIKPAAVAQLNNVIRPENGTDVPRKH